MSYNCVDVPTSFDRFREIWSRDYEYRIDENGRPEPICLFCRELRSGREIFLRRHELLSRTSLPYNAGPDTLTFSYAATAELGCDLVLGFKMPTNTMCTFGETCATINGFDAYGLAKKRPSLIEACGLYGIPCTTKAHKDRMRDLILNNRHYSEEQWAEIRDYNIDDVNADIPLFLVHAPTIEVGMGFSAGDTSKRSPSSKRAAFRSTPIISRNCATAGKPCGCTTSSATTISDCGTRTATFTNIVSKRWPKRATGGGREQRLVN
jgi:hypothetical protein